MRDINLLALVVCIAGGLYVYKYYPRDERKAPVAQPAATALPQRQAQQRPAAPQQETQQQAFTPPPVLYKCETASGQTTYKDTPCPAASTAAVIQQAAPPQAKPTPLERQIASDKAAEARRNRADEELARQWDQRMAQRDRDLNNEQASLTTQAAAAGAACAALRQEREGILANLRHGGTAQWMNYWNDRFHAVSDALYRNHC